MQKILPYLWFEYKADQVTQFYKDVFKDVEIIETILTIDDKDIMTQHIAIYGFEMVVLNGGPFQKFTPANSFFVYVRDEEIASVWEKLSLDGKTLMDFGPYPFSKRYGWVEDKYGMSWQIGVGDDNQIIPFWMFTGENFKKASQATRFYIKLFEDSGLESVFFDDEKLSVKHANFKLFNQAFMAIDSDEPHGFSFSSAVSYMVLCESQEEIDTYWSYLKTNGIEQHCGWLKDKFGITWQIVPWVLLRYLNDPEMRKQVYENMFRMTKIEIKGLLEGCI
ncbi:MAG: VOC family protein [Acholeplasmataceae bacterium]|nr:VOC family protein [Acholeplasmataceae bacterium]